MVASYAEVIKIVVDYQWVMNEIVMMAIAGINEPIEDRWSYLGVQWQVILVTKFYRFLLLGVFVVLQHQMIAQTVILCRSDFFTLVFAVDIEAAPQDDSLLLLRAGTFDVR